MKRVLLNVIGDLHVNSTLGLCPPKSHLSDGGSYTPSPAQRLSWNKYLRYRDDTYKFAKEHKCEIITVVNGESADKNWHKTTQKVSDNESDIIYNAAKALEPMLEISKAIFITRGTEAHVGASGYMDELVGHDIGAVQDDDGNYSWWFIEIELCGTKIDIAHHPGFSSSRPWTRHQPAGSLAAKVMMEYAKKPEFMPDIVLRAHNHHYSDSFDNYPVRAIIAPPWQLTTSFAHKLGYNGEIEPVGGINILCEKGSKPDVKVRKYDFPSKPYMNAEDILWKKVKGT